MDLILVVLAGLSIGSFVNVLIDRLPEGESIVWGRSHCDYCKKPLRWFELIPVLSYILQQGRCRRCRRALSVQYPLVELATAAGFGILYLFEPGITPALGIRFVMFVSLLVIFMIDFKHQIIPDGMLITYLLCAVVLGIFLSPAERFARTLAALAAGGFFLALWLITRGRGIGFGDVKLGFAMGLSLGGIGAVIAGYTAFLTGAVCGVILMISGKAGMRTRIAFGPFLVAGMVVSYFFGASIWAWWLNLL